ncbi:MAG: MFS transporter, partial [Thermostichales cyanobacterium SZTDM-1c_bins_54]
MVTCISKGQKLGGYRWQIGAVCVGMLLFLADMAAFLPILPLYITERWGSQVPVGWVVGAFAVGVLVARPGVGWALDCWGRKPLLWLGLGLALLAHPLYIWAPTWGILSGVRLLHGVGLACFATAAHTLVADLAPPQERVAALGYLAMVNTIGFGLGPTLASWWFRSGGFPLAVQGLTGLLLLILLGVLVVPDPAQRHQATQGGSGWAHLLRYPVREATFFVFVISALHGLVTTFLPLWIPRADGFYGLYALAAVVVRFALGRWGESLPAYRGGAIALVSSGVGVMGLALWPDGLILWALLHGIGFGLLFPVMSALVALATPSRERGRVYGVFLTGVDLGVAVGSSGLSVILTWLPLGTLFLASGSVAISQGFLAFQRLRT